MISATNLIESMNAQLRKVTRYRGQFPSEQAALMVLYPPPDRHDPLNRRSDASRSAGGLVTLTVRSAPVI